MRDGFLRVAAGTPCVIPCAVSENTKAIIALMREADQAGVKLLVLPELALTGCSCGDMFLQPQLQNAVLGAVGVLAKESESLDVLTVVGLPLRHEGALYNAAAVIKDGIVEGFTVKTNLSAAECRWFAPGRSGIGPLYVPATDSMAPVSTTDGWRCADMPSFSVQVQLGGDSFCPSANIVARPAALVEMAGEPQSAHMLLAADSARGIAAHVFASAGPGESTGDMVYSGRRMIYENGHLIKESGAFSEGLLTSELDLSYIEAQRVAMGAQRLVPDECAGEFNVKLEDVELSRAIDPAPFIPSDPIARAQRCEQILGIQTEALAQRMRRIGSKVAVLGVSGGLDSTLAMIVAARAIARIDLDSTCLHAITMPCFGTTERTKNNAYKLAEALGSTLREINIADSVTQHFKDIGHDMDTHDAAYENAQARERTQIIMDIANMEGGIGVGTGDISELALGWATYNGDHMSMYCVNGGVPKTLMRHIVRHVADAAGEGQLRSCLLDILDTPVSPELLPPKDGVIAQKTEELVGPYELHDFFLYHMVGRRAEPAKIRRLAVAAFKGTYSEEEIGKWLKTFVRRFFTQQFKRNCLPEGPMVGRVTLSPRGGLVMPSDASSADWMLGLQ